MATDNQGQLVLGFRTDEGLDDVDMVLAFLKDLPDMLSYIFLRLESPNLFSPLFFESLQEARKILENNVSNVEHAIAIDEDEKTLLRIQLKRIGFTGTSLQLKSQHVTNIMKGLRNLPQKAINWSKDKWGKLIRKSLKALNNILNSLKAVFPGVDAIKEIKDVGEELMDVAEEGDETPPNKVKEKKTKRSRVTNPPDGNLDFS